MNIVEPKVEIYREPDHLRKIEYIARVCTGTQELTGSKPGFVERLIQRGHTSVLEHVRVNLTKGLYDALGYGFDVYGLYDRVEQTEDVFALNVRDYLALGGSLKELAFLPEAGDYLTVKFVCDIGISRELCRHRQMSFTERSTRYVNMKDGIEFVRPRPFVWHIPDPLAMGNDIFDHWQTNCTIAECNYRWMIEAGRPPQEARTVLPLSTATTLYMSGMIPQWKDVLKLRLASGAHPQMRYLMQMLVDLPDCPEELKEFAKEVLK